MALLTADEVLNKKFQATKFREGYDQDRWLEGVDGALKEWLGPKGPLEQALGAARAQGLFGVDLVSLGSGEGLKEVLILRALFATERVLRTGRSS